MYNQKLGDCECDRECVCWELEMMRVGKWSSRLPCLYEVKYGRVVQGGLGIFNPSIHWNEVSWVTEWHREFWAFWGIFSSTEAKTNLPG